MTDASKRQARRNADVRALVLEWCGKHGIDHKKPDWSEQLVRALFCADYGVSPDDADWALKCVATRAERRVMRGRPGRPAALEGWRLWRIVDEVLQAVESGEEPELDHAQDQELARVVIRESSARKHSLDSRAAVLKALVRLVHPDNPWQGKSLDALKSAATRAHAAHERQFQDWALGLK